MLILGRANRYWQKFVVRMTWGKSGKRLRESIISLKKINLEKFLQNE